MKKRIKTISLISAAAMLLAALSACGSGSVSYRDDVSAADIATAVDGVIENGPNMKDLTDTYVTGSMEMDASEYEDYCVKVCSKGTSIDEYGIFKGADSEHTEQIEQYLRDYIQMRIDSWMTEYLPEEYPKLENAEVKVCGNYVMYAILSDDERTAAFDAFEAAVTEE